MEALVKFSQRLQGNALEQYAARKFGLRDPRNYDSGFTDFFGQISQTPRRLAVAPEIDEHGGVGHYFHEAGSFFRVALTVFSSALKSRSGRSGNDSAASIAAPSVPLGGINRSITAEKVSSRPFFQEASLA